MQLKKPVLFINFKTYAEATGQKAKQLALRAEQLSKQKGASIALVVQATDLRLVSSAVKLPVFAQHIDPIEPGSNTGLILPEAVKQAGAVGTVLNHAENKRDNSFLSKAVERAKQAGLLVMACAENTIRAKQIASFPVKPDLIAVEPPDLIGGKLSVSAAKPELITDSVAAIKAIDSSIGVVTGAGIKKTADVKRAIELGAVGVFVASGIVGAPNQKMAIANLLKGFD